MTSTMRGAAVIITGAVVALIGLAGPVSADPADPAGPEIQPVAGGR